MQIIDGSSLKAAFKFKLISCSSSTLEVELGVDMIIFANATPSLEVASICSSLQVTRTTSSSGQLLL